MIEAGSDSCFCTTWSHLLLAFFNAFQPGVFALSGWDLVGTLPLPRASVQELVAQGDTRWINRGAYNLMAINPEATTSTSGLPRAQTLYGSVKDQLQDPNSFASELKHLLQVRNEYHIEQSEQVEVPVVRARGLLVMVHKLPESKSIEVSAINFGREPVHEVVPIHAATQYRTAKTIYGPQLEAPKLQSSRLKIDLAPLEAKALLLE